MLSLRALGNLTSNGAAAKAAAHYYSEKTFDYYAENSQEDKQGFWMGSGCDHFGVKGGIDRSDLQMALAGYLSGKEVKNVGSPSRQMGWDLTFSAPKSVSVLWAVSDNETRREIEQLHQKSIEESFKYLESKIITRKGRNGVIKTQANLVAGVFTHFTSRAGDPQLHSHVVVPNICARLDGIVGTIKSKEFYEYKMTAGALYQAEFAYLMRQKGYAVENGVKGTFRLRGLNEDVESLFSKRDQQIDKIALEKGISNYVGTRKIVVDSRKQKEQTTIKEREEFWKKEIEEQSLEVSFDKNINSKRSKKLSEIVEQANQNITSSQSVYKEKDIIRELAKESLGALTVDQITRLFHKSIEQEAIIEISDDVYSTKEMIDIEKKMIALTKVMAKSQGYFAGDISDIHRSKFLSEEQKRAIESATGKSQIVVIQGRAGTGKTTIVNNIKQVYEKKGYRIEGLCLSGQAAQNLEKETGVVSKTIALWELKNEVPEKKQIYIVDEAGMVGSKQMANVLEQAKATGTKVILIGDERQLQPINAGGALAAIDKEILKIAPQYSSQIETIRRQKHQWMKDVVCHAARGDIDKSIEILDQKKKIQVFADAKTAKEKLVKKFLNESIKNNKQSQILTHRKADAFQINTIIRGRLKEAGKIQEESVLANNGQRNVELSVGDKIVLLKNDYKLDVRNGQQADVIGINKEKNSLKIQLANEGVKDIPLDKYSKIEYGWALTTHKAQGMTVDNVYVYGFTDEHMASRQSTYVQLSRQRDNIELYIVDGERSIERAVSNTKETTIHTEESLKNLSKNWGRDRSKDVTLDYMSEDLERKKIERKYEVEREI